MNNNIDIKEDMAAEYDFSQGVRGKHFQKLTDGYTVTVYSPNKENYDLQLIENSSYIKIDKDVNAIFKTSEEVNNALRVLISAIPKRRKIRTV